MRLVDTFQKHPILNAPIALIAGVVGACAFAPVGIWACVFVSLAVVFLLISFSTSWKWAALTGWLWGIGYFSLGLSWTYRSMAVFGGLPSIAAAAGVLALAAALALVPAAAAAFARRFPAGHALRISCVLPALWTLGELVRGVWICNFGWLSTGYALIDTVFSAWAPVVGVYGVGFVVHWVAGLVVALLLPERNRALGSRATLALALGAVALSSVSLSEIEWAKPGKTLEVRIVQPDLPVVMAGGRAVADARLDRVTAMSTRSGFGSRLDLIIWPEGLYPLPLQRHSQAQVELPLQVAKETGATVLFNAFDEPQSKSYFNSHWTATPEGALTPVYAKHHLVPFGEYVPWGFRWLVEAMNIPMSDQKQGALPTKPIEIAGIATALQICYEVMFGEELAGAWKESNPQWMINTANLAWFSPAAAEQFTQMTRMRAREFARPVVQSMNNAMSAVVTADGKMERNAGHGAQTLDARVQTMTGPKTLFAQYGHLGAVLCALFLLLSAAFPSRDNRNLFRQKKA